MPPSLQQLIDIANSFYPKGICFELESELYHATFENRRLRKAIDESAILEQVMHKFLALLNVEKITYYEIGPGISLERCFQLAFISDIAQPAYLILCISKISPYYCFYSLPCISFTNYHIDYIFTENFSATDKITIERIKLLLNTSFPNYQLVPLDYLNHELVNVEYDELGLIHSDQYPVLYQKMKIFNALFSTHIYY